MKLKIPTTIRAIEKLIKNGEGLCLEFKRSTGELKEALQTLCAFLNGDGGLVIVGVSPKGSIDGQQVSDKTLRDISQALNQFEPPVSITPKIIKIDKEKSLLVLHANSQSASIPFSFDGRAYERISSSTRQMPKAKYEQLLLDRMHKTRRWENLPAIETELKDIDKQEVFRIIKIAESLGRFSEPVGRSAIDVLKRLELASRDGRIYQGAVVLFGKKFTPFYMQCELKMARFKGKDKTEFLDQKNVRGPAVKLLEEAEIFCQRHFPLPAKILPTQMQRVERPLIPPEAMREILVNAIIHRDYSIEGGSISLAIFDDRVEIWNPGRFLEGITPAALSKKHPSVKRNPNIADVFHRIGLIENWGRGTNRVIELCKTHKIPLPKFEEIAGFAVVTFFVDVGVTRKTQAESKAESKAESLQKQILETLKTSPLSKAQIAEAIGKKKVDGQLNMAARDLLVQELVEYTIPGKPNSRLQKYQLTEKGRKTLDE